MPCGLRQCWLPWSRIRSTAAGLNPSRSVVFGSAGLKRSSAAAFSSRLSSDLCRIFAQSWESICTHFAVSRNWFTQKFISDWSLAICMEYSLNEGEFSFFDASTHKTVLRYATPIDLFYEKHFNESTIVFVLLHISIWLMYFSREESPISSAFLEQGFTPDRKVRGWNFLFHCLANRFSVFVAKEKKIPRLT